jgi:hypothetical protein
MAGKACPKCGSPNMTAATFCARCGARLAAAEAPGPGWREKGTGLLLAPLERFLAVFPGLASPSVIVASTFVLALAGGLGWLSYFLLRLGDIFFGPVIGVFAMITYWAAWSWVLHGEVCMLTDALVELDGRKWLVMALLTAAPLIVLICL